MLPRSYSNKIKLFFGTKESPKLSQIKNQSQDNTHNQNTTLQNGSSTKLMSSPPHNKPTLIPVNSINTTNVFTGSQKIDKQEQSIGSETKQNLLDILNPPKTSKSEVNQKNNTENNNDSPGRDSISISNNYNKNYSDKIPPDANFGEKNPGTHPSDFSYPELYFENQNSSNGKLDDSISFKEKLKDTYLNELKTLKDHPDNSYEIKSKSLEIQILEKEIDILNYEKDKNNLIEELESLTETNPPSIATKTRIKKIEDEIRSINNEIKKISHSIKIAHIDTTKTKGNGSQNQYKRVLMVNSYQFNHNQLQEQIEDIQLITLDAGNAGKQSRHGYIMSEDTPPKPEKAIINTNSESQNNSDQLFKHFAKKNFGIEEVIYFH